jgi:hypothetical protein
MGEEYRRQKTEDRSKKQEVRSKKQEDERQKTGLKTGERNPESRQQVRAGKRKAVDTTMPGGVLTS